MSDMLRARADYAEYQACGGTADWQTWWTRYRDDNVAHDGDMSTTATETAASFAMLRARHDFKEYRLMGGTADWSTWWTRYRDDYTA